MRKYTLSVLISIAVLLSSCTENQETDNNITSTTTGTSVESTSETTESQTDASTSEITESESQTQIYDDETEEQVTETTETTVTAVSDEEQPISSAEETKQADKEQENQIIAELESQAAKVETETQAVAVEPEPINIYMASAPGTVVYQDGSTYIDASNASRGYVCVKHSGNTNRLKVQIKTDSMKYNYDLNSNGVYEVYPLQMGNGTYTVKVLENISGTSYSVLYSADIDVRLSNAFLPFLYNSQYVDFSYSSAAVKKSYELCAGCTTDIEKLKAIYSYMVSNIKYDYDKAATVKSGYIPDPDKILSSGKGICFDYASLLCTMLRAQRIPTQLVIGSAGSDAPNHAWNEVYLSGVGWITLSIENTKEGWKLMDATFGAGGYTSSTYTAARVY